MHRQVGDLKVEANGVALRGLLVRHLVMPGHEQNTQGVLTWIASHLGTQTYLSLMDQYRPAYRAAARPELRTAISREEYARARKFAVQLGFTRIDESLLTEAL
jgi:putative pyruvate formate lyase activating enzyme